MRIRLLIGVVAACLVFAATGRRGLTLFPDSMSYLSTAMAVARSGAPLVSTADWHDADSTSLLTQFPPLYPMTLAPLIAAGVAPGTAARLVGAAAAGVTTAVAAGLAAEAGGAAAGALAVLFLLLSPPIFGVHLAALSEPLFLALLALAVAAVVRDRSPWIAGIFAALAGLTRYVGVGVSAGVALCYAMRRGQGRARAAAGAVLPGLAAQLLLRVVAAADGATVPSRAPHPFRGFAAAIGGGGATFARWLAPALPQGWRAVAALAVGAALGWLGWRTDGEPARRLLLACTALAAAIAAVLLYARRYVGGEITFDDRILAPLMAPAAVAAAVVVVEAWRRFGGAGRAALAVSVALWSVASAVTIVRDAADQRAEGVGYEQDRWQRSSLAAWLRSDGRGYAIYTNDPPALWFLDPRPSRQLPAALRPDSVAAFAHRFAAAPSVLVGFSEQPTARADSLARALGLRPLFHSELGTVWGQARS